LDAQYFIVGMILRATMRQIPLRRYGFLFRPRYSKGLASSAPLEDHHCDMITRPVTVFTDDEQMVRDMAKRWAQEELQPLVRDMDNEGAIRPEIIDGLFQCGLMGMVSIDSLS
jgi:alkylation response protein AidB-like acyl-CoA dehydrogenase